MSTVYVVMGSTGEYSDRSEWPVVAYTDKELAEEHVKRAEMWCAQHGFKDGQPTYHYEDYEKSRALMKSNPYDGDMHCDYTGTRYFIYEVPTRTEVPR